MTHHRNIRLSPPAISPQAGRHGRQLRHWRWGFGVRVALLACLAAVLPSSCSQGNESEQVVIGKDSLVIDVRTAREFKAGHLANAINIPYTEIASKITAHVKNKTSPIVLYCHSGYRASVAKRTLAKNGYTAVVNAGSYGKLKASQERSKRE